MNNYKYRGGRSKFDSNNNKKNNNNNNNKMNKYDE